MLAAVIGAGSESAMDDMEKDKVRRYLLGMASQDEQSRVEERLGDDRYYEQFSLVEDDLIDDYVLGLLSEAEREGFTTHFLGSPEHREKLSHVEAVAALVSKPAVLSRPAGTRFRRFSSPIWRVAVPLGAAAVAVLVMSLLLLSPLRKEAGRLAGEKEVAEAKVERLEQELEAARAEATNSNEKSLELERMRKRVAELEEQLAQERLEPPVIFSSSRERTSTRTRKLTLRRTAQDVKFQLFLPDTVESDSYRASLTQEDDVIWLEDRLRAKRGRGGRFIEFRVPVRAFNEGRYVLVLETKVGSKYEKIDAYPLDILMR